MSDPISAVAGGVIPGTFVPDIPDETPTVTPLAGAAGASAPASGPSFKDTVVAFLNDVNQKAITSDQNVQDLASGKTNDLNKVVTSVEEANLALQFAFAMKSQILNAYNDISKMTV